MLEEITRERRENEVGKLVKMVSKVENEEGGGVGVNDRFLAANRWPEQETMALLRIRSDMDVAFRDSGSKAPLWDEVARRMAELGYHRSDKKCREKFENIYKYHKRQKNSSYARSNGKTYRFFDQLEALDYHQTPFPTSIPKQGDALLKDITLAIDWIPSNPQNVPQIAMPISSHFDSSPITTPTSNTSSLENEFVGARPKKRKLVDFFDKVMKSVLEKQEDLQNKFLEALDKCDRERLAREEAWRMQEMARIKREHKVLMQERSVSAAKDTAILAFLQNLSEQGRCSGAAEQMPENPSQEMSLVYRNEADSGENSSTRWPKNEVEALIMIRSNMDLECHRIEQKGVLWEDVSMGMKKMGYDRSAKRCKEKWENINKYYRRVKDINKQRPLDSKTCSYFNLLDALYSLKTQKSDNKLDGSTCNLKPEELLMHMMNHHTGQQPQVQEEQVLLQQEQGEMIMNHKPIQNSNDNEDEAEDEDGDYDVGNCGIVGTHPSPVEVKE